MKSTEKQIQPVLKPRKYTWGEILDTVWLGLTLAGVWGSVAGVLVAIIFF